MFKAFIRDAALLLIGAVAGNAAFTSAQSEREAFGKSMAERKSGVTLDIGISDNRATPSPDGQWYQKDQDGTGRYKTTAGTFGVSFDLNPAWTVGIHYVNLGRYHVDALAVAYPEDDRAKMAAGTNTTRPECNPQFAAACLYQWHTASYVRGINFSTSFKVFEVEGVRFDAKVGAFAHKLSSSAIVEPLGCRDNCPWRVQIDQSAERIAPMWGAVVSWKWLAFAWESYERIGEHTPVTANVKGRVEAKTILLRIPVL